MVVKLQVLVTEITRVADIGIIKTLGMAVQAISIMVVVTEVVVITCSAVTTIVLHIRVVNRKPLVATTVVL